jgi:hypothetical protein
MPKSIQLALSTSAALASLAAALLLTPASASAGNTVSQGHGVKCYWVLVSSNPATGSQVHKQVCRKSGV